MKALLLALLLQLPPPGSVPRLVRLPIDDATVLYGPITNEPVGSATVFWLLWTHADPEEAVELAISFFGGRGRRLSATHVSRILRNDEKRVAATFHRLDTASTRSRDLY